MKRWFSGLRAVLALSALMVAALMISASCLAEDDFLEPEDAFRFSARLASRQLLEVHYQIADGYYMYRERFRFEVEPQSVMLGEPHFPGGEWQEDENFGRSEIFRREVSIQIPIVSDIGNARTIRLVAISQGCADGGICYLPSRQTKDFESLGIGDATR